MSDLAERELLTLPNRSIPDMRRDLELFQRLEPVAAAVATLVREIADTRAQAQSECWWATTAYYTSLRRLASRDLSIEVALRPAFEFFSQGPRATKGEVSGVN